MGGQFGGVSGRQVSPGQTELPLAGTAGPKTLQRLHDIRLAALGRNRQRRVDPIPHGSRLPGRRRPLRPSAPSRPSPPP